MLPITASKTKSKSVWTSYGIAIHLVKFLHSREEVWMQTLNRFWYEIGVSRVYVNFKLNPQAIYFTHPYSTKFDTTIFKYDYRSGSLSGIVELSLNLKDKYIVQVRQDLYGFKHNATPSQLLKYSNLEGGKIRT